MDDLTTLKSFCSSIYYGEQMDRKTIIWIAIAVVVVIASVLTGVLVHVLHHKAPADIPAASLGDATAFDFDPTPYVPPSAPGDKSSVREYASPAFVESAVGDIDLPSLLNPKYKYAQSGNYLFAVGYVGFDQASVVLYERGSATGEWISIHSSSGESVLGSNEDFDPAAEFGILAVAASQPDPTSTYFVVSFEVSLKSKSSKARPITVFKYDGTSFDVVATVLDPSPTLETSPGYGERLAVYRQYNDNAMIYAGSEGEVVVFKYDNRTEKTTRVASVRPHNTEDVKRYNQQIFGPRELFGRGPILALENQLFVSTPGHSIFCSHYESSLRSWVTYQILTYPQGINTKNKLVASNGSMAIDPTGRFLVTGNPSSGSGSSGSIVLFVRDNAFDFTNTAFSVRDNLAIQEVSNIGFNVAITQNGQMVAFSGARSQIGIVHVNPITTKFNLARKHGTDPQIVDFADGTVVTGDGDGTATGRILFPSAITEVDRSHSTVLNHPTDESGRVLLSFREGSDTITLMAGQKDTSFVKVWDMSEAFVT